jgi:predicted secreted protein
VVGLVLVQYYYQFYFNIVPFGGQKKLMKSTIETGTVEKAVIPLKHLKVLINHSTILLSTLQAINYYLFHKK